ncbi:MAG: tyrosine-type recombinase/integrase [Planctomycetes bacterium]|nr:tyrosine-type recombinase/integrase [Planctomycetota bacterium]
MRLDFASHRYRLHLRACGRSQHTMAQIERHVGALCAFLGPRSRLESVRPAALARYFAGPAARQTGEGKARSAATVNAMLSTVRSFFRFATQAGWIRTDPSRLLRRARCAPAPPRALAPDEVSRLLDAVQASGPPRDRALFAVLAATGLRLGSALSLDVADLDFGRREITVRRAKGNRPTTAVMPEGLARQLEGFVQGREHGPLFEGAGGRALSSRQAQRLFAQYCTRARIHRAASPHSLRHSLGQRLYEATGDVLLVQAALSHRSIRSTLVYAQADRARVKAALDALGTDLEREGAVQALCQGA